MNRKTLIKNFKRWMAAQNIVHVCHQKMCEYDLTDNRWNLWHDIKMKCYRLQDKDHENNLYFHHLALKTGNGFIKKRSHFIRPSTAARIAFNNDHTKRAHAKQSRRSR